MLASLDDMTRLRLGEILRQQGQIDELQLNAALSHQRQWGGRLGNVLLEQEMVDELALYEALAAQSGMRLVSIVKLNPSPDIARLLPLEYCQQKRVVACAYQEHKRVLGVATSEPQDMAIQEEVAFRTGLNARVVVAPEREIEWAIRRHFEGDTSPCPPPRQRREMPTADEFKIVDAAGKTVMKSIEQLRAEHKVQQRRSQEGAAQPAADNEGFGEVTGPFAISPPPASGLAPLEKEVAKLRAGLADQTIVIRCLVNLCLRSGLFTAEELRAAVQEGRRRD